MSKTIVLVSCVSDKEKIPSPARFLYITPWFKKASRYVDHFFDEWFILSAKYGLVNPGDIIAPYNLTLKDMSKGERRIWSERVFNSLSSHLSPGDKVIIFAGKYYREFLPQLISKMNCTVEIPLQHMGIGDQMHWFDEQMRFI